MCSGSTSSSDSMIGSSKTIAHRDVAGSKVDQQSWDKQWVNLAIVAIEVIGGRVVELLEIADA